MKTHGTRGPVDTESACSLSSVAWRQPLSWQQRSSPRVLRLFAFCVFGVLISSGCGQPVRESEATKTVVGTLPDGTRYELRVPAGLEVDEVEGVAAVPVWADGPSEAVGVSNFVFTKSLPSDTAFENTTIVDDRLIVPAGSWALVVDLYDHSIGREADLAMIQAREESGLPVLELPPSLRFPQPNELPVEMEVMYRDIRVVRGCARHGLCSPNGEFMVVPIESDTDLSGVQIGTPGGDPGQSQLLTYPGSPV